MTFDDKTREFLTSGTRFAVLSTINSDGFPQQTVMWFDVDGEDILMNTAIGRVKDQNLRRNPKASICVEDGYSYVTVTGTIILDEDVATAQADIKRLAIRYYGQEKGEASAANFSKEQRVTLRLKVERIISRI